MNKPFSLLIKPASADCNLRCRYCFYLDHLDLKKNSPHPKMNLKTLNNMVYSFMATKQKSYAFGWQGGEPALMGLNFFKKVVELQMKYGSRGTIVSNGLQTNATIIDDKFSKFFSEYNFLIGVSLDGPAYVHDKYRRTMGGQKSHHRVIRGIESLKQHNVEFNILSLVNSSNVAKAEEVYDYYLENGFNYLQFIPCVEFDENNKLLPFSITGEQWGDFLCAIFDKWIKKDIRNVSIRYFDSLLHYFIDGIRNVCQMGGDCRQYFVVEHNGDVFPCDFFVRDELKLGNINEDSWEKMQNSEVYEKFGIQKADWNSTCDECEVCNICMGDCLKHRIHGDISDSRNRSHLCRGIKKFLNHSVPEFKKLADQIIQERQRETASSAAPSASAPPYGKKAARNDPCPCGSGKKFKKCCGY